MTPQNSTNKSSSDIQIIESESEKTDVQVQSMILKPTCPETMKNNELEVNYESEQKREEEGTLHVREPNSETTRTSAATVNIDDGGGQNQGGGGEESGRERLKRHRVEVAGQVWIPDMWGQEELLKDWIDCSAFDASLMNSNIMLARAALVRETTTPASGRLRIENSC
ncbi:hypothetical protein M9H77_24078 [Catharanthus roseus]|uniref:Uncharacterized protein n=1 Tax=Catharanthus roseus TaxID=4058 RepID=A0ACC0AWM3_CATRO|nr:hypothetical protein M9H77_24078 [Catharanthus roseus]